MSKLQNKNIENTDSSVIEQLVSNITSNKINTDNELVNNNNISEKNICKAAVKLNTYGSAFENINKNNDVYLVKEEINGNIKTIAYIRCSKTSHNHSTFCHIHEKMNKLNSNALKIFDDEIIPKDSTDKTKWKATIKDEFFDNMRKKKNNDSYNSFNFSNKSDPILLILNNSNSKLYTMLYSYANQLLKDIDINTKLVDVSTKNKINKNSISKKDNKIITNNYENNINDKIVTNNIEEIISSDNEDDKFYDEDNEDSEDNEDNEDNESDNEEIDPDGILEDMNGNTYYLKKNFVFKPDNNDHDHCICIGSLFEIREKYHTIKYNDKYYSIFHSDYHERKGYIYICILTNKVFDNKKNFIGTLTKIDKNNHTFNFFDEL
jgi:hypothetical protein